MPANVNENFNSNFSMLRLDERQKILKLKHSPDDCIWLNSQLQMGSFFFEMSSGGVREPCVLYSTLPIIITQKPQLIPCRRPCSIERWEILEYKWMMKIHKTWNCKRENKIHFSAWNINSHILQYWQHISSWRKKAAGVGGVCEIFQSIEADINM